jgi:hypothetical protein
MAEASERPAKVPRNGAHISALAAIGLEHAAVAVMGDQRQALDRDRAGRKRHVLPFAGEVVGALAADLDRRKAWRNLLDRADKGREGGLDGVPLGKEVRGLHRLALGVVGVGLDPPGDGEDIGFPPVHDERHGLGGLAERDRQDAGGERIERAACPAFLALSARLTAATA